MSTHVECLASGSPALPVCLIRYMIRCTHCPTATMLRPGEKKFTESWEFGAADRCCVSRPKGKQTRASCCKCRLEGTALEFWNVHSPRVCREAQKNPPPDEDFSYPMAWARTIAVKANLGTGGDWRSGTRSSVVAEPATPPATIFNLDLRHVLTRALSSVSVRWRPCSCRGEQLRVSPASFRAHLEPNPLLTTA